jgi:hypothetical protein
MPAPSGQISPRGPLAGPSQADEDTGRPGSLGEEPHAELSNHLDEGLDHDDRGGQHVDHDPELPAAVVGAEDDAQETGDAADHADQAPGGRLGLQQSQAVAVIVEAWAGLTSVSFTPALPIPSRSVNSST